jgi:AbrB family looped-hinge helix DNA binding protein
MSKISAKYHVVIPKELRKQLQFKPGQRVEVTLDKDKNIKISTASVWDELAGNFGGRGIWTDDPTADIRQQRDEWTD